MAGDSRDRTWAGAGGFRMQRIYSSIKLVSFILYLLTCDKYPVLPSKDFAYFFLFWNTFNCTKALFQLQQFKELLEHHPSAVFYPLFEMPLSVCACMDSESFFMSGVVNPPKA